MTRQPDAPDHLLAPAAVAAIFNIDQETVNTWAQAGRIDAVVTSGGHRRYLTSQVLALLDRVQERRPALVLPASPGVEPASISMVVPEAPDPRSERIAGSLSEPIVVAARAAEESAAAVVAEAVAIALEAESDAAAEAVLGIASAVAAAAEVASQAAAGARGARMIAAEEAARLVAADAEQSASEMRARSESAASQAALAAVRAASLVVAAGIPGQEAKARAAAALIEATVQAAADATARENALAAATTASAVSAAAAGIAQRVAAVNVDVEAEVAATAQAIESIVAVTAGRVAAEAKARAAGAAVAAKQAAAALAVKDDFVATVSHELRSPLASILGSLEIAAKLDAGEADQLPDLLAVATRNANRLLHLVTDLLKISELGSTLLVSEAVDLSAVVEQSLDDMAAHAQGGAVEMISRIQPGVLLVGDQDRLRQVTDNLLSNAVKYTLPGGHVWVTLSQNQANTALTVTDTGIGVTEPDQGAVFTKFARSRNARDSRLPGAGLGLSISKEIVEAHGGTIGLASSEGAGTTVLVTLPRELDSGSTSREWAS